MSDTVRIRHFVHRTIEPSTTGITVCALQAKTGTLIQSESERMVTCRRCLEGSASG